MYTIKLIIKAPTTKSPTSTLSTEKIKRQIKPNKKVAIDPITLGRFSAS